MVAIFESGAFLAIVVLLVMLLWNGHARHLLFRFDHLRFFNAAPDLICIAGLDGYLKSVNPSFTRVLGFSKHELLERPLISFIHDQDRDQTVQVIENLRGGGDIVEFENRYRCKDGSYRSLLWNSKADLKRGLIFATARDITQRKLLESTLAISLAGEQTSLKRLQKKAAALERSNQELSDFAHVVAHDLQEPLRTINSYCSLLHEGYAGKMGRDADELIGFTLTASNRMKDLIHDLLIFGRVDSAGMEYGSIHLHTVIDIVLQNLKAVIANSNAVIHYEGLPEIYADERHMTQLFQNLIVNAIKYRSSVPPVIVITAHRNGTGWKLSVRDNGIGIAPRHHERIFGMFKRLHARDQYEGTGIGLALCKKIVDLHGGKIWVESNADLGSTFHFTLLDHTGTSTFAA